MEATVSGSSVAGAGGRGDGAARAGGLPGGLVARRGWQVLATLGAVIVLLGLGDVVGGVAFEPTGAMAISGRSLPELQAASPEAYRVIDFRAREGGITLAIVGILLAVIAWRPYRLGKAWAWWTVWALPVWASSVLVAMLIYGLAPGQPPSSAALSGPLFSVIAGAILLADRRRFASSED
jgi:hypothetical protein